MDDKAIHGTAASALAAHSKDAAAGHPTTGTGTPAVDTVQTVAASASQIGERAYSRASEASRYVSQQVGDKPVASLLLGIAIGYVIAFVIHGDH